MKKIVILSLSIFLLAGCSGLTESLSGAFGKKPEELNPPAPLLKFQQNINVVELWSRKAGGGTDKQYLKLTPLVANQRIYAVDSDGELSAMDATNGRTIWERKTKLAVTSGTGYGQHTVLVGSKEGDVAAYDYEKGKELWRTVVSSEILSPPQRAEDIVVVRTIDGKIYGLSGNSGERLWIYDRGVPSLSLRGTSTPVIDNGIVVTGFDGGRLAALELSSGRLIWEARIADARGSSELERMVDIDSEPVVIDGVIYVATFQGQLAAVQIETGRIIWSRDISSYAGFTVDTSNVYLTDDLSHIWAIDRYTGATQWEQDKLQSRGITAPASIGNYIVVGDFEGYLHWMDKYNGAFVARVQMSGNRIIAPPFSVGKVVYAFCTDGKLAAYTYR